MPVEFYWAMMSLPVVTLKIITLETRFVMNRDILRDVSTSVHCFLRSVLVHLRYSDDDIPEVAEMFESTDKSNHTKQQACATALPVRTLQNTV